MFECLVMDAKTKILHRTTHDTPMAAMAALAADTIADGGYSWLYAECWYGTHRQWRIDID